MLAVSPICALVFSAVCGLFAVADLRGRPAWLGQRRLQPASPRPTAKDYLSMLPVVLRNGVICCALFPPVMLPVYRACGTTLWPLPSAKQLLLDLLAIGALYDLWFWACHRAMHLPVLYRYHKLHHSWTSPCALEGAYFGVLDFTIGNYGPMLLLPPLISQRLASALAFGCLGVTSVAMTHCGYDIQGFFWFLGPLAPSSRHDVHHEFFDVNFSTFGVLDWITNTYASRADVLTRRTSRKA